MKKVILLIIFFVQSHCVMSNNTQSVNSIHDWKITPTSLVKQGDASLQRIEMSIISPSNRENCILDVFDGEHLLYHKNVGAIKSGTNDIIVEFPAPNNSIQSRWVLMSNSKVLTEKELKWNPPRHWTLYVIKSAHIDIGLHDSPYKQRYYCDNYIDKAVNLIDLTKEWPDASRFRYVVEGQWWWNNYVDDRPEKRVNEVIKQYVKSGFLGIGASHSGNHTQVFGTEELCRSTYYAQRIRNRWDLKADAMIMADNNGISWPLVSTYADAGIKYIGFFPNAWNPKSVGASRIDFKWNSKLPHLFYWLGPDKKSKILVWGNPHYRQSANAFGFETSGEHPSSQMTDISLIAPKMAKQLSLLESKYPYNIWLIPNYADNEKPSLLLSEFVKKWNEQWRWPELRTVGDLSLPFREVEKYFGNKIPTLTGIITGGWAQHPLSTPNLLAKKLEVDRLLPTAEKLSTIAYNINSSYSYPTYKFQKAWSSIICNDEHGYGVSYYKGRPVYDTWMQKRDWIEQAYSIAKKECERALNSIASQIKVNNRSILVFNPTLQSRIETLEVELLDKFGGLHQVEYENGDLAPIASRNNRLIFRTNQIPSMGYKVFKLKRGKAREEISYLKENPPTIENDYYRIVYSKDGTIASIYDKELNKELLDKSAKYNANQFVYTNDAHETFFSPDHADFEVRTNDLEQVVITTMDDPVSGALINQKVSLPAFEKRIDIDNKLDHVSDLASKDRWNRFGYYAFPFDVPSGKFRVGLNGCDADPYKDQTGHGTDTYHVARDWAYVGNNQYGIALLQQDNYLIEFGEIHKYKNRVEKTPSSTHFFPYLFNDWLYANAYVTGPSYINLRYRFTIFSHEGNFHEGNIPQLAERKVIPLLAKTMMQSNEGKFTESSKSFFSVNSSNVKLLTLKLSDEPGKGFITRFHETNGVVQKDVKVDIAWEDHSDLTLCTLPEKDKKPTSKKTLHFDPFDYKTIRLTKIDRVLPAPNVTIATCTDNSISLIWPAVNESREYHIFRGDNSGFTPDYYHWKTTTQNTSFTDDWLSPGTTHYYRVASVDNNNFMGSFSTEINATTYIDGDSPPAKVGIFKSRLISSPRAWRGDEDTILYIQWGQNREKDLAYYEIFRSENKEFELNDETFVSNIDPGPYVTVPFKDTGLKPHTIYYYHVRAVDRNGERGNASYVFQGTTREKK